MSNFGSISSVLMVSLCFLAGRALASDSDVQMRRARIDVKDIIRIEIGEEEGDRESRSSASNECRYSKRIKAYECVFDEAHLDRMNSRIKRLERAVRQLQDQVFELSNQRPTTVVIERKEPRAEKPWVCTLTSEFKKTYTGRASSQVEARAVVMQQCESGESNGMWCKDEKISCGQ